MTRLEKRRGVVLAQPPIQGSGEVKTNANRMDANSKRNHGFYHGEENNNARLWSINFDWRISIGLD